MAATAVMMVLMVVMTGALGAYGVHYLARLPYAPACPACRAVTAGRMRPRALDRLLAWCGAAARDCPRCGWSGRMRWRLALQRVPGS